MKVEVRASLTGKELKALKTVDDAISSLSFLEKVKVKTGFGNVDRKFFTEYKWGRVAYNVKISKKGLDIYGLIETEEDLAVDASIIAANFYKDLKPVVTLLVLASKSYNESVKALVEKWV